MRSRVVLTMRQPRPATVGIAMGELARPDHAGMRTFVVLMTPSNEFVNEHP